MINLGPLSSDDVEKWKPSTWSRLKAVGSHPCFISEDRHHFFKCAEGDAGRLRKEYDNLCRVHQHCPVVGLRVPRPVTVLEPASVLVAEFVDGQLLANIYRDDLYHDFGKTLRDFHNSGYRHSHLQVNDVLVTEEDFVLTDLGFLNEESRWHDLALFKLSCQLFSMKRPWRWFHYARCFDAFRKGYGFREGEAFAERMDYLLRRWRARVRARGNPFLRQLVDSVINLRLVG